MNGFNLYQQEKNYKELKSSTNLEGVKLLMTNDEVNALQLTKAEKVNGFGGFGLKYLPLNLFVSFYGGGKYQNKVAYIEVRNPKYSILGFHVGDQFNELSTELKKYGIKPVQNINNRFMLFRRAAHESIF